MSTAQLRAAALAEALTWRGTPYQHQASLKGAGCDCLGLVRGVWRALYGAEPETPPPYTPDWAEMRGEETLLAAAQRWLVPVAVQDAQAGDVLLFRMAPQGPCNTPRSKAGPIGWCMPIGDGRWSRAGWFRGGGPDWRRPSHFR
jgi:putative phage cell wall peptidase, NlpC/P60 family